MRCREGRQARIAHAPEAQSLMSSIGQIDAYARFALGLRRYLRERATPELGRQMLAERQRHREVNLLSIARRAVYDNQNSPYLPLLRMAGCEYGDLERMVRRDGVEGSLRHLRDAGVFISIEEFKGKRPVVRGDVAYQCQPADFDNTLVHHSIATRSSGTRGVATRTTVNLERLRHSALSHAVALSAHGAFGRPAVLWLPILPSSAGFGMLMHSSKMGMSPARWFSPVARRSVRPSLSSRLATLYVVHAGRLFGTRMPVPEYVSGEQVGAVADYLLELLRRGHGCVVFSTPSSAARVSQVVTGVGSNLAGATFVVSGEPLTPAKMAEIRAAQADAVNLYAFAEGGLVGFGCADMSRPSVDDIHVLTGAHGIITRRRDTPFGGGVVDALLYTTLLSTASKVLLNVESGDYGVAETRACSCELGASGLTTHLHSIRSYDKLTGEGMTFVGTDMVRIVEEVLPARLGGASTDYQIVELESARGTTSVQVVVSEHVGEVDEAEVVSLILAELRRGNDTQRMMAEVWRERGVLKVHRGHPHVTAGGKLLPLYVLREGRSQRSQAE